MSDAGRSIVQKLDDTAENGILRGQNGMYGIGVALPTSMLHVCGDVRVEDDLKVRNHVSTTRGLRISAYGEGRWCDGDAPSPSLAVASAREFTSSETAQRLDALAATLAWCSNAVSALASSPALTQADVRKSHAEAKRYAKGQVEALSNCARVAVAEVSKAVQELQELRELRDSCMSAEEADVMYVRKSAMSQYPTIAQANAAFLRKAAAVEMFAPKK
jgi:hypothetical protein